MSIVNKAQFPDPVIPVGPKAKKPRLPKEKMKKKSKVRVPAQPKDVNAILDALTYLPDMGSDIYDALAVEPMTKGVGAVVQRRVRKSSPPSSPSSVVPTVGSIAADLAHAAMLEDVTFDKPPPFRGVR
jgi:hypothetical protein